MNCEKHPKYNGVRWKKKRCEGCDILYKHVHKEASKYGKYKSLTTPKTKCGIIHLVCEVSCLMLYGNLPPFFWLKSSNTPREIRDYFNSTNANLKWRQRSNLNLLRDLENVLYHTFVVPYKKTLSEVTKPAQAIEEEKEEIEPKETKVIMPTIEKKKSKWELIND